MKKSTLFLGMALLMAGGNQAYAVQYTIDGDNRIYVNGKAVAHIKYSYGEWRINCESKRLSGDSNYRKYSNKDQVIATALSWCKH